MRWYYPTSGKQSANANFTPYRIGFNAKNLILINDSPLDDLEFSWNGTDTHGHVLPGEPLNLGDLDFSDIWIKKSSGTVDFRIWAYAR